MSCMRQRNTVLAPRLMDCHPPYPMPFLVTIIPWKVGCGILGTYLSRCRRFEEPWALVDAITTVLHVPL